MLKEKNIVITGCLQGIGKETLKIFAENEANIFACAYQPDEEFETFCADLSEKNSVKIYPVYFDMSDNSAVVEGAKKILSVTKEIHGLVNIAGINKDALFNMITYKDLIDTFQVNFFSQIIFSQYISKAMQRNKTGGSIVFTSSVVAQDGNRGQTVYGASKAALIGAMKSMALELGEFNIRVNAVAPGVIKSPMTDKLPQSIIDEKIKVMDIARLGTAEEVAEMYLFLMTDFCSHVTGQVIRVDGGM